MTELELLAKDERNTYARAWRAKNKDKVKQYNENHWKRRVLKKQAEQESLKVQNG